MTVRSDTVVGDVPAGLFGEGITALGGRGRRRRRFVGIVGRRRRFVGRRWFVRRRLPLPRGPLRLGLTGPGRAPGRSGQRGLPGGPWCGRVLADGLGRRAGGGAVRVPAGRFRRRDRDDDSRAGRGRVRITGAVIGSQDDPGHAGRKENSQGGDEDRTAPAGGVALSTLRPHRRGVRFCPCSRRLLLRHSRTCFSSAGVRLGLGLCRDHRLRPVGGSRLCSLRARPAGTGLPVFCPRYAGTRPTRLTRAIERAVVRSLSPHSVRLQAACGPPAGRRLSHGRKSGRLDHGSTPLGVDSQPLADTHPRLDGASVPAAGPDEGSQQLLPGELLPAQRTGECGAREHISSSLGPPFQLAVTHVRPLP